MVVSLFIYHLHHPQIVSSTINAVTIMWIIFQTSLYIDLSSNLMRKIYIYICRRFWCTLGAYYFWFRKQLKQLSTEIIPFQTQTFCVIVLVSIAVFNGSTNFSELYFSISSVIRPTVHIREIVTIEFRLVHIFTKNFRDPSLHLDQAFDSVCQICIYFWSSLCFQINSYSLFFRLSVLHYVRVCVCMNVCLNCAHIFKIRIDHIEYSALVPALFLPTSMFDGLHYSPFRTSSRTPYSF